MTPEQFKHQASKLEEAFRWTYPSNVKSLMYQKVKNFSEEMMIEAVNKLISEELKIPMIPTVLNAFRTVASYEKFRKAPKPPACHLCEDTGIKLRRHRKDLAADFYCDCNGPFAIPPEERHDWTLPGWNELVRLSGNKKKIAVAHLFSRLGTEAKVIDLAEGILSRGQSDTGQPF